MKENLKMEFLMEKEKSIITINKSLKDNLMKVTKY